MMNKNIVKVLSGLAAGIVLMLCGGADVKAADAYYVDVYGQMHEVGADDANSIDGMVMAYDVMPNWGEMLDFNSMFEFPVLAGMEIDIEEFRAENEDNLEDGIQAGFQEDESNNSISMEGLDSGIDMPSIGGWDPIQGAIMMHHMAFFVKTGMWFTEY